MFREDLSAATSVRMRGRQDVHADISAFAPSRCDWTERAIQRLTQIHRLQSGWDGHDGRVPDRSTISFTASILANLMHPSIPMPDILPLSFGGLQIEWHRNQWDVEIEIVGPYKINVWTCDLTTGVEDSFFLTDADMRRLSAVISKIART